MSHIDFSLRNQELLDLFSDCSSPEAIYDKIIELGKAQSKFEEHPFEEKHLVAGCQSKLWLITHFHDGRVNFATHSEALISSGLAQLLVRFFQGASAQEVLTIKPDFLFELNIPQLLTPSRANGLHSLHLKMKQDALQQFVSSAEKS